MTGSYYFTEDTENWIIEFNKSGSIAAHETIFNNYIYKPLSILVDCVIKQNLFNKIACSGDFENITTETLTYVASQLHNYNKENGNAFGYLSIITRNYLMALQKKMLLNEDRHISLEVYRFNSVNENEDEFRIYTVPLELITNPKEQFTCKCLDRLYNAKQCGWTSITTKQKYIPVFDALYSIIMDFHSNDITDSFKRFQINKDIKDKLGVSTSFISICKAMLYDYMYDCKVVKKRDRKEYFRLYRRKKQLIG